MKYAVTLLFLCSINQSLIGQNDDTDKIICIFIVAPIATFPGGMDTMYSFLRSHITYPTQDNVEGTVYTSFDVEEDGLLTNIRIKRGIHPALDEEAIRVVRLMPQWIPAIDTDTKKPLKTHYTIPIKFKFD